MILGCLKLRQFCHWQSKIGTISLFFFGYLLMSLTLFRRYYALLRKNRYLGFALFLWRRFGQFDLNRVSASLTYTTLLALVPFFTITLIVIKAFPMFADLTSRFNELISSLLVPSGVSSVQQYLQEFAAKAGNLTAIGIVILAASAIMLMMTIERTFNQIWQVSRPRPLMFRLLIYWCVLTLGPLAVGVAASIWNFAFKSADFTDQYPILANILYLLASILFYGILLCLLYRVVPYRYVPMRHALIGGMITALVFEIVRRAFGFYVGHFNSYALIYGAFAAIPLFLLWIFCLWYVLLGGAVLTAGLSHWQDEAFRRLTERHGRFNDVVRILSLLAWAQNQGHTMKIQDFRQHVNLGYDALGEVLEQLSDYGYVVKTDREWVLKMDTEHIQMDDLFRRFVYRPLDNKQDAITTGIHDILNPGFVGLNVSLRTFLEKYTQKEGVEYSTF